MKMTFDPNRIRVASPCQARWEDMDGDDRTRYCRQCGKHVFNLSALSRAEIEELVRETEGKFCGRFHRRADGTMLTTHCSSHWKRMRGWMVRSGGMLCALLLSAMGCAPRPAGPPGTGKSGAVLMGDVAVTSRVETNHGVPGNMGRIVVPPATNRGDRVLLGEVVAEPGYEEVAPPRMNSGT